MNKLATVRKENICTHITNSMVSNTHKCHYILTKNYVRYDLWTINHIIITAKKCDVYILMLYWFHWLTFGICWFSVFVWMDSSMVNVYLYMCLCMWRQWEWFMWQRCWATYNEWVRQMNPLFVIRARTYKLANYSKYVSGCVVAMDRAFWCGCAI